MKQQVRQNRIGAISSLNQYRSTKDTAGATPKRTNNNSPKSYFGIGKSSYTGLDDFFLKQKQIDQNWKINKEKAFQKLHMYRQEHIHNKNKSNNNIQQDGTAVTVDVRSEDVVAAKNDQAIFDSLINVHAELKQFFTIPVEETTQKVNKEEKKNVEENPKLDIPLIDHDDIHQKCTNNMHTNEVAVEEEIEKAMDEKKEEQKLNTHNDDPTEEEVGMPTDEHQSAAPQQNNDPDKEKEKEEPMPMQTEKVAKNISDEVVEESTPETLLLDNLLIFDTENVEEIIEFPNTMVDETPEIDGEVLPTTMDLEATLEDILGSKSEDLVAIPDNHIMPGTGTFVKQGETITPVRLGIADQSVSTMESSSVQMSRGTASLSSGTPPRFTKLQKEPTEEDLEIRKEQYIPNLHGSQAACEQCLLLASAKEKSQFEESGRSLRIVVCRGGCRRNCSVFPRGDNEAPVRLCQRCYHNTHRTMQKKMGGKFAQKK